MGENINRRSFVKKSTVCIADLNLIRKPDLCVVDTTEFILTKGPSGPDQLEKQDKVVAGVDRVAVDSFVAGFLGLKGKEVILIQRAYKHGLGEINLDKITIKEASV